MALDTTRVATAPRVAHAASAYRNQSPSYDPRTQIGIARDEPVADNWTMCQQLGTEAHAVGDQGIRAYSATGVDTVLVVFRELLGGSVAAVFDQRVLTVDTAVARRAAALHVPDPAPVRDALIGATALVHQMTVVTHDVGDFVRFDGLDVVDPRRSP